jgi:hypothetical protein
MNRQTEAPGAFIHWIFRGKTGTVDGYAGGPGRFMLSERVEDICTKIVLERRDPPYCNFVAARTALRSISKALISIAEHQCLPAQH